MASAGGYFGGRGGYWAGGGGGAVGPAGPTGPTGPAGTVDFTAVPAGTVGSPALRLGGDTTSGLFRPAANVLGWSISGAEKGRWDATGMQIGLDGSAAAPSVRWGTNDGFFHGTNAIGITCAGAQRLTVQSTGVNVYGLLQVFFNASAFYIGTQSTDSYIGPIYNVPLRFLTNGVDTWSITATGMFKNMMASNQQTTVGAAGAASALPGVPRGYFKFVDQGGTTVVVPYWIAA